MTEPNQEHRAAPTTPWVTVRGQNSGTADGTTRMRCTRCLVVLVVPGDCPSERYQDLLIGFEVDHRECTKP